MCSARFRPLYVPSSEATVALQTLVEKTLVTTQNAARGVHFTAFADILKESFAAVGDYVSFS